MTPPFYTYDHGSGSAVIGGPFYTGTVYPQQYRDSFFFGDYSGNFIKRVVFDSEHRPVSVQPFATGVESPVSLTMGPDGMIYYLSFTTGEIRRIRYNGPVAKAAATPTYGYSPLVGVVLERRLGQPRGRVALIPLGLRRRHDLDRRQSVAYLHVVDRSGRSRLGSR